jgi:hypothetical protein
MKQSLLGNSSVNVPFAMQWLNSHHMIFATQQKKIFLLLERPNLFAIYNNTFSKWWEG